MIEALNPRRILICGDAHGNAKYMHAMAKLAKRFDAPVIVQLGDFGLWPQGEKYLAAVTKSLEYYNVDLLALPGNHDDYDQLPPNPLSGVWSVSPRITMLPKGTSWTWSTRTFAALGGAYSIDYEFRTPHEDYWPDDEELHAHELDKLSGKLDVLFSHDAPYSAPLDNPYITLEEHELANANRTRLLLDEAVRRHHPYFVFHGHWHLRASHVIDFNYQTQVESLASDAQGDTRSWGLLDVGTLYWTPGNLAAKHKQQGML